ncbi:MAG: DNA mismatch repair endonuclease MutL [Planctomycetota bacterium]|nr:DNA mismatch repair endonuclease MutL [Planctomycetota bacterium]
MSESTQSENPDTNAEAETDAQAKPEPGRIAQLETALVNQIAAGEVVERPASVVKELVENALDAGADRLLVELEEGGRSLIRVTDNGSGIHPEDLPLAICNHATSKIREFDDLFAISSLGFRGEALASIGSVSQFKISSRQEDKEGFEIAIDGGKVGEVKACGIPTGTRVEVRNLFFNVPARRKFLKTKRSELNAITNQLTRLALSRPDVFLTLRHNSKQVLNVPPADDPRERIARLTTQVVAEELLLIGPRKGKRPGMELWGYVSPFNITRHDSRGQYFFVNNRAIRDPLLLSTIKDSYLHLLPPRRQPYVFLWLSIDPGDVDVNVHPAKTEVRFRYSSDVYALMVSTIKIALADLSEAPPLLPSPPKARDTAPQEPPRLTTEFQFNSSNPSSHSPTTGSPSGHSTSPSYPGSVSPPEPSSPIPFGGFGSLPPPPPRRSESTQQSWAPAQPRDFSNREPDSSSRPRPFAGLSSDAEARSNSLPMAEQSQNQSRPGLEDGPGGAVSDAGRCVQFHNSFIVEEAKDGLKIIDQHALHERILYDEIVSRLASGRLETQRLLFPVTTELEPGMIIAFDEIAPILMELGFELEREEKDIAIKSIPRFVKQQKALQIVLDLLAEKHPSFVDDEVEALDKAELKSKAFATPEGRALLHTLAASLACKAAIKFGMTLSQDEIDSLLTRRHGIERAYCCPHGRPTTLNLPIGELRRRFGRPG